MMLISEMLDLYGEIRRIKNPRCRAELRAAQRRTLVYLLRLAGVEVPPVHSGLQVVEQASNAGPPQEESSHLWEVA